MAMEYLSWWPTSSWMSPGAALFLLCNVLIGAIVVTSRGEQQRGRAAAAASSTRRLCRSASSMVLDRLRSFSVFSVHPIAVEEDYHHSPSLELQAEEEEAVEEPAISMAPPASAPVAAPSATSESAMEVAETGGDKPVSVSSEEAQTQCPAWQGHAHQSHAVPVPESQSSPRQPPAAADVAVATAEAATSPVRRRPSKVAGLANAKPKRRQSQAYAEAAEGKAELNERAEQFIRQFKQELRLQRINSVLGAAARL
ncbi:hypothetical protein HU200_033251 [Digitaria exilis]|uniref:DUF4408 domain-containing protein n=1 Tax=Digitaria exilis TaxID=1010633 RepID=A0A835BLR2_9POAL|nr:hypothetical protein HU200_033251 [Digitaria exilis]